jgi:chemotaxis protein MotB
MEQGAMDSVPPEDLAAMRDMIFDDANKDLDFQQNKYVQILSINDRVLFQPGSTILSREGVELLDKILPYLQQIKHPLLVAGHTATQREEEGSSYRVQFGSNSADSTWLLSFQRAMAVYRHLTLRGIPPEKLMLEAFGQFHPRYSNNSPEGRQKNRRVDIVLDRRNTEWIRKMEELQQEGQLPESAPVYKFKGFDFTLTMPGGGSD